MGHWLLAVPAWWSFAKKQTKKHSVGGGPLSASAHRENARYARLPVQPWWVPNHRVATHYRAVEEFLPGREKVLGKMCIDMTLC